MWGLCSGVWKKGLVWRAATGLPRPALSVACLLTAILTACAGSARAAQATDRHDLNSPHFVFSYPADKVLDVAAVQLAAEAAWREISDTLQYKPEGRIPVIIYEKRKDFRKDAGVDHAEFVVGTANNRDGSIRLDGSKLLSRPEKVIGHEVAHIFLFKMLGPHIDALPLWMNEGLAQQLGGEDARNSHNEVESALYDSRIVPLSSLAGEFPPSESAGLAYAQGQDAVVTLLGMGGWDKMRSLLSDLKEGKGFDASMRSVYGFSAAEWDGIWLRSLRAEARRHEWIQIASWVIPALMFIALAWGVFTVRRHHRRQVEEEAEPVSELEPPSWWREDEFRT